MPGVVARWTVEGETEATADTQAVCRWALGAKGRACRFKAEHCCSSLPAMRFKNSK
jgi:hypothetical protein